jgi:hypothetical protein
MNNVPEEEAMSTIRLVALVVTRIGGGYKI